MLISYLPFLQRFCTAILHAAAQQHSSAAAQCTASGLWQPLSVTGPSFRRLSVDVFALVKKIESATYNAIP